MVCGRNDTDSDRPQNFLVPFQASIYVCPFIDRVSSYCDAGMCCQAERQIVITGSKNEGMPKHAAKCISYLDIIIAIVTHCFQFSYQFNIFDIFPFCSTFFCVL